MKQFALMLFVIFICVNSNAATETINWYSNGSLFDTTTCQSGDDVNLPSTTPTKYGHTFAGWLVAFYDFSTLDTTINGAHRYGRGVDTSNDTDTCYYEGNLVTCNTDFSDLGRYQWKTLFSYGTIYGDAMCSTVPGTYAVAGTPTNDGGQYCWCKATGYLNNDIIYSSNSPLSWVFNYDRGSASACAYGCARSCALNVQLYADFRRAVFGVTQ